MSKNSTIDYLSCIILKVFGPGLRSLPKPLVYFLGRLLGELFYAFDLKHRALSHANIKAAFSGKLSPCQISGLTKDFYRTLGQNIIEVLNIPLIDKRYLDKFMSFEGLDNIGYAFKRGKGVILVSVHAGSWELSNIICANLGFPFILFVNEQGWPRLNNLLNSYRRQKGCQIIARQDNLRQLIGALNDNKAIGMTIDQGGKSGTLVKFFGREASMATGAVKLALKYDAAIVPVFFTRVNGPKIKVTISPVVTLKRTQNPQQDILDNLQGIINVFEGHISNYPKEYLWTYKIWKYGRQKNILILSDGKTGHLRQSQAVSNIISDYLKERSVKTDIKEIEVQFKNKFSRQALIFSSGLSGKYHCQGCLWCLRTFLEKETYNALISIRPDIVISCGSAVAPVNYVLSRENLARSIAIMRPSFLSVRRFDLVIMPRHDKPPKRRNVLVTEGALNLINEGYLQEQTKELIGLDTMSAVPRDFCIGFLIGGDTKNFRLEKDTVSVAIKQVKSAAEDSNAGILVTTSRRTNKQIEGLVKEEFAGYPRCRQLILANEKNIPQVVGGILGLSRILVVSPESISMICEAVSSAKYTVVFNCPGLGKKHQRFLKYFSKNRYIYMVEPAGLAAAIKRIKLENPKVYAPSDNFLVREAISKIL